jgi:hypothetical protein
MRKSLLYLIVVAVIGLSACTESQPVNVFYGEKFEVQHPMSVDELLKRLENGSIQKEVQVEGVITKSCTHSGCWLMLESSQGVEVLVTYKEEAFTTAKNIKDRKVVLKGTAEYNQEKERYDVAASGLILN